MDHQNDSPDNARLEGLLKLTSQRLGTTPEALKQAAENGDLSSVLEGLEPDRTAAVQKVLSDPEAARKLLSTPQAQKLFRMFQKDASGQ